MVPTWKTKEEKTSEFLEAGGYNRNERAGNWRLGIGRQRGVDIENYFTLGRNKCENIKNLYINKKYNNNNNNNNIIIIIII